MAAAQFRHPDPDRFVVGTVGEPGARTFYIQARSGALLTSVVVEKAQVAVLADRIEELLDSVVRRSGDTTSVPPSTPDRVDDLGPLEVPLEEEFRAGTLALAWVGETEHRIKRAVAESILAPEVRRLVAAIKRDAAAESFDTLALTNATIEVLAFMPVYRADYAPLAGMTGAVVREVERRNSELTVPLSVLVAALAVDGEATRRFGQVGGAITAKAVEDTMFYQGARLVSLQEVGGNPGWIGALISDDDGLGGSGQAIDANRAKDLAFCQRDKETTRTDDFVHRRHRCRAKGHGSNGLGTTKGVQGVDLSDFGGCQDDIGDAACTAICWGAGNNGVHAGDASDDGSHKQ